MAQTVANLNGTVADLTNRNKEMAKTISTLVEKIVKFENIIKTLNEKTKNLEDQLAYEKKLRCGDSDSSNSPPLVKKKWYVSNKFTKCNDWFSFYRFWIDDTVNRYVS